MSDKVPPIQEPGWGRSIQELRPDLVMDHTKQMQELRRGEAMRDGIGRPSPEAKALRAEIDLLMSQCCMPPPGMSWEEMAKATLAQRPAPVPNVTKWSTRLEGGCPTCVVKHLGQALIASEKVEHLRPTSPSRVLLCRAIILAEEARTGYTGHWYLAQACVAEAELQLVGEGRATLRKCRLSGGPGEFLGRLVQWTLESGYDHSDAATAWAHIAEAIAELPRGDSDNRGALLALESVPWPDINDKFVPEVSRILRDVVELYELGAK